MFSRPELVHTQAVELNTARFSELRRSLSHVKYATIIVPLFKCVRSELPVAEARRLPNISDESIAEALSLEYPLEEFLLYNIVEGFLYQTKQSRVDKDTTKSLRPDLGTRAEGQKLCQDYIMERYREDYEYRLKQMAGEEKKLLCKELLQKLLETDSMPMFCNLLSEGVARGAITFKISNFNSAGCLELHDALLDKGQPVVRRAEKLQVFYTGEDDENAVWNGGNMYRTSTDPLRNLLLDIGEESTWSKIEERYHSKVSHVYRGEKCRCNRHGHSNELPSYFAFGHDVLTSFVGTIADSAWADYAELHTSCCGVAEALQNPEKFKLAIEHLKAKRTRRAECLSDPAKRDAAIRAKQLRRGQRYHSK